MVPARRIAGIIKELFFESVKISPEVEKVYDALPNGGRYKYAKQWTPEEDAILLKYWPIKKHFSVAKRIPPRNIRIHENDPLPALQVQGVLDLELEIRQEVHPGKSSFLLSPV